MTQGSPQGGALKEAHSLTGLREPKKVGTNSASKDDCTELGPGASPNNKQTNKPGPRGQWQQGV